MPAPKGNQNARKWTFEKTNEILTQIEAASVERPILFLKEALECAGVYPDIWAYWREIWMDNEDITDRMKLLELRFEIRLLNAAAYKKVHAGIATLVLEHNYGYRKKGKRDEEEG
jgi:hypothetical protein